MNTPYTLTEKCHCLVRVEQKQLYALQNALGSKCVTMGSSLFGLTAIGIGRFFFVEEHCYPSHSLIEEALGMQK